MVDDTEERLAFDWVPEIYDRVRPVYPDALFDEVFDALPAGIPTPSVLEIGAGTGKATASILARGARVTAVEPGPNMAEFLRRKFAHDNRLSVVNATFEDAGLPPGAFHVVFAATSWHWVDPNVRLGNARDVLTTGGALGVVSTNQIAADTDRGYFARSQDIYRRYFPEEDVPHLHGQDVIPEEFGEIEGSDLFGPPLLHRYRWDQTYSTADYADLMRTYSGMQMMAEADRESLIAELSDLIDREFDGAVTRPLVITLTLAFLSEPIERR